MSETIAFRPGFVHGIVNDATIGSSTVRDELQEYFDVAATASLYAPIPAPTSIDDWLAKEDVSEQTFDDWQDDGFKPITGPVVVLPIGPMNGGPDLAIMKKYVTAFFLGVDVVVLDEAKIRSSIYKTSIKYGDQDYVLRQRKGHAYTANKYEDGFHQYLADSLLRICIQCLRDTKAFCVVGITMLDLYSSEDDDEEFTMGLADPDNFVTICSFARYLPKFQLNLKPKYRNEEEDKDNGKDLTASQLTKLVTLRGVVTMTHEILHLFGVRHCVYNSCMMQGRYTMITFARRD